MLHQSTSTFCALGDIPKGALVAYDGNHFIQWDDDPPPIAGTITTGDTFVDSPDTIYITTDPNTGIALNVAYPPTPHLPYMVTPWNGSNITIINGNNEEEIPETDPVVSDYWIGYMRYTFFAEERVCISAVPECSCGHHGWESLDDDALVIVEKSGYIRSMFTQEMAEISLPLLECTECEAEYYHLYIMG